MSDVLPDDALVPVPAAAPSCAPAPGEFTINEHADGVYFDLPSNFYFADRALGSTNLKDLASEPATYWYTSHLNPARPEQKDTRARILGSAFHALVLEGRQAFDARYVRRPDDVERMTAKVRAEIAPGGQDVLTSEDYDRVLIAGAMVARNPALAGALTGGASEVSLFWTEVVDGEPVRRKARFDYLKPRAIVDLKSTSLQKPIPFAQHCADAIGRFGYSIQAAAYLQARAVLPRLVAEGRVFGDAPAGLPERVAAAPDHAFVFLFWASSGAPLTWGGVLSPGNPLVEYGQMKVGQALTAFVDRRRRFGADAAWVDHQPIAEIQPDDIPGFHLR